MKVAVTGCAGFVGTETVHQLLERGYEVRGVDCFLRSDGRPLQHFIRNNQFEFLPLDLCDPANAGQAMEGVDGCIHLAALVGLPVCERHKTISDMTNEITTENLLSFAKKEMPFIYSGTGSSYGRVDGLCTEETPSNPLSRYGMNKWMAEERILRRNHLQGVVYRFSTGYGVSANTRTDLLINSLVIQAVRDKSITVFEADAPRSFISVQSMAESLIFALENSRRMAGQIYNVGDDSGNLTKRELAEMIRSKTGCFVSYADSGYTDGDARFYRSSFEKINRAGWKDSRRVEDGVDELIRAVPLLGGFPDKL